MIAATLGCAALVFFAGFNWSGAISNPEESMNTTEHQRVIEIAYGMIKSKAVPDFTRLNAEALAEAASFDGYVSSQSYVSVADSSVFLDIVEWESLEQARQAAKIFEKDERFAAYVRAIEKVTYFDHVAIIDNGVDAFRATEDDDILEFASFYLNEGAFDQFVIDRKRLMQYIGKQYQEFKRATTVRSLSNPDVIIDLVVWDNAEICHTVQKELEPHELFQNFIRSMNMAKESVMQFFRRIR